jgi:hypothetical protein
MKPLLFVLCSFVSPYIHGQKSFGIKSGMNWANFRSSLDNITNKGRADFYFGGFTDVGFSNKLLVRPELLYSNKGSVVHAGQKGTELLHYLTLPLLAGFRASRQLTVFAGPKFGYLLSAESNINGNKFTTTRNYDRFDKGLDLGFAFQLNRRWGTEIRYNYGFEKDRYFVYPDGNKINVYTCSTRVVQAGLYFSLSN